MNSAGLVKISITYIVLVPHDIEESIQRQVEVSSCEASESSQDAADEEHAMQVLLSIGQQLLHLLGINLV